MNPLHGVGLSLHRKFARARLGRPRLIIIFGTMRSGTTLFARILTDNPEICGFGESHVVYSGADNLLDLKYWIFRFTKSYPRKGTYLFDKILHASHTPDLGSLMETTDLYPIFMVRGPIDNARSLQKMFNGNDGEDLPWDYLTMRYSQLEGHLGEVANICPVAALSYEELTKHPDTVLAGLSDFLNLSTPLRSQYETPSYLGRWGIGDGSENIRAGEIIPPRNTRSEDSGKVQVPPDVTKSYLALTEKLNHLAHWAEL